MDVDNPDRPVYLLGESFGAVLALAVAAAKTDLVDRLVLVNPATSYEASIWPRLGPVLANLPDVRSSHCLPIEWLACWLPGMEALANMSKHKAFSAILCDMHALQADAS